MYGGPFKVGRRLAESHSENIHVASKRPFGRIFGNPDGLGRRGYPALEKQYDMKHSTERIFGSYMQGKGVADDNVVKRPFGSVYGRSYKMGKRPFGSVYGRSYKMGKRPFGGVYGKSYKMGKRYALPLYAHLEEKRPFGKVYGKSYQYGKRPFGGIYRKNYGKTSFNKYRKDQELHMPFMDIASLRRELENSVGHKQHAKRLFGIVLNSKTILGKRHDDYADSTTEKLPFGPIYSPARSFSKRTFPGTSGYPNDFLMLLKRPFGQVYGTSYRPGKRSPRFYDLKKRSADTSVVVVVDGYGQPILLTETTAQDERHPTYIQSMANGDEESLYLTNGAPYTYDIDVPDSQSSLSTVFENGEEQQGGIYSDNDDVMKEGDFQVEVYDSNGSDDDNENLSISEHIEFPEHP